MFAVYESTGSKVLRVAEGNVSPTMTKEKFKKFPYVTLQLTCILGLPIINIWHMLKFYTGYTQKNGAVSKVSKKFISHLTRAQRTPSAAATVQVSHALPAVRFSCLLRGRGASFQDGVAAGKGFLRAPFSGVQICDYSAA